VDRYPPSPSVTEVFIGMDLTGRHVFPSDFFQFAFAEDFLEHLDQAESLIFLAETFRTLRAGGVLRLSFPGLQGVLRRHYRSSDWQGCVAGRYEAFSKWEHKHFFCEESLALVARHLGFSTVRFLEYGTSDHDELRDLDYRSDQKDLNIYAELTK
jgi:predicted SAM-dependent methyltransferase